MIALLKNIATLCSNDMILIAVNGCWYHEGIQTLVLPQQTIKITYISRYLLYMQTACRNTSNFRFSAFNFPTRNTNDSFQI